MKSSETRPQQYSPVALIAVVAFLLSAGGTLLVLRGSGAPPPPARHLTTQAEATAVATQERVQHPTTHVALAQTLPSRQLKLGDSFTYHLETSRQLAAARPQ